METNNIFADKIVELEVLCNLMDNLNAQLKDARTRYEMVESDYRQATDWRTGELKWKDDEHTIPVMEDRYDYVMIPEDELTEDQKRRIVAIEKIRAKLEKLA